VDASLFVDGWLLMTTASRGSVFECVMEAYGVTADQAVQIINDDLIHGDSECKAGLVRNAIGLLADSELSSLTAPERRQFREFVTANRAIAKFRSCQPHHPASAAAAKPSWAVAARAAAASPGPRTRDAVQARSAATTQTGATCASTALSAIAGDVLIAAGDLN
jgi:hypothetical protein